MPANKRLLITGANGFVAGSVLRQAGEQWQVHALSRGAPPARLDNVRWHRCEPAQTDELARCFRDIRPDAVIHAAALADIDFCQTHPALAQAVNVDFTRRLAELCADSGARLVFCSTDTVFDGEHAPYDEDARPQPVNVYARTKVEAERCVAQLGRQGLIARLALVVGLPVLGAGNSFLARMLTALRQGRPLTVPAEEVRTPVDVLTAGRALLELAAGDLAGVIHLAGHDRLNRLQMGRRIAAHFGCAPDLIQPRATGNGANGAAAPAGERRAPRPRDVSLDNAKACATLRTPMRTFDEALALMRQTHAAPTV